MNKLAHAWGPSPGGPEGLPGDMHIDDDDDWSGENKQMLLGTVVHEIGHIIGLKHSQDIQSVMYPVSTTADKPFGQDDKDGVNALYGRPVICHFLQHWLIF